MQGALSQQRGHLALWDWYVGSCPALAVLQAPLLGAHNAHGCSAKVGAGFSWWLHHCLSPARKRCLLTSEDSITCELSMKQAAACKPAASGARCSHAPWEASWGRGPGSRWGVGECWSRGLVAEWHCSWLHVEWGRGVP